MKSIINFLHKNYIEKSFLLFWIQSIKNGLMGGLLIGLIVNSAVSISFKYDIYKFSFFLILCMSGGLIVGLMVCLLPWLSRKFAGIKI